MDKEKEKSYGTGTNCVLTVVAVSAEKFLTVDGNFLETS
jgi:hypothetical protein